MNAEYIQVVMQWNALSLYWESGMLKTSGDYVGAFKTIARVPYSEISDSLMVISRFSGCIGFLPRPCRF
ncbi:MAG: hypothetical protein IPP34_12700 [Bacteroidetes bacterium]|nr:hypothetical protein [Bacteroidota bacterium]